MIIDSGKLHSLIWTITCKYLKFYAKGERFSSFIQELFSTYNMAGTAPVSGNIQMIKNQFYLKQFIDQQMRQMGKIILKAK